MPQNLDSSSRNALDAYARDLFGVVHVADHKAPRQAAPRCPICGHRGRCSRACERRAAGLIDIDLRWAYIAALAFSHADVSSSRLALVRGAPERRPRMK